MNQGLHKWCSRDDADSSWHADVDADSDSGELR